MEHALGKLKKAYTKLFANYHAIFLLAFIALVIPSLAKGFDLHGSESYFYYRITNFVLDNNIPGYDFLSFGGRAFLYNLGSPLFLVLINLIFKVSVINLLVFVPILFGFLSVILFYLILKRFNMKRNVLSFSCYILILSPAFLYSFVHFTSFTIPLFLNFLGFYLILNRKKLFSYIAFFIYLILPLFGFIHVFFGLVLLFFHFYENKEVRKFIPYSTIILPVLYLNNHFIISGIDVVKHELSEYFFILGGEYSLSIFLIALALFGLVFLWEKRYKNSIYYLFIILNLFILFLNIKYIIYITLISSVLGAYGLRYIYKLEWSSHLIRDLTVIILIGGILVSGVIFLSENSRRDPDQSVYNALVYIGENTDPRDVILSHEKYGIYINSVSARKNFVDINRDYAPRADLRFYHLNKIFYSRDMTNLLKIFKEFKIDYIMITPEMKNGLVWSSNNQGLLYLINNNQEYFKLAYNEGGVEVWGVS